jgi:hypothetical protein
MAISEDGVLELVRPLPDEVDVAVILFRNFRSSDAGRCLSAAAEIDRMNPAVRASLSYHLSEAEPRSVGRLP